MDRSSRALAILAGPAVATATFMLLLSDVTSEASWVVVPLIGGLAIVVLARRRELPQETIVLRLVQYAALVFVMLPVMLAVIVLVAYAL